MSADEMIDFGPELEESWQLQHLPNWGRCPAKEVAARDLTQSRFFREFTDHWEPVVIRGACRSWPAVEKWSDDAYLISRWGNIEAPIYRGPNPQGSRHPAKRRLRVSNKRQGRLSELIETKERNHSIRSFPLDANLPIGDMVEDLDDEWLIGATEAPLSYKRRRIFLYKGSVSIWHHHSVDEHMTYQMRGAKDFALLPPEQWKFVRRAVRDELFPFPINQSKYPEWRQMQPLSARLGPGDGIYIPPLWAHTVVPVDQNLGITLATTWRTSRKAALTCQIPAIIRTAGCRVSKLKRIPMFAVYGITGWMPRWS